MVSVAIAEPIAESAIEHLKNKGFKIIKGDIKEIIKEADAIIVRSKTEVTSELINTAKNLKIIARAGVGVDNIDVETATEKGILVVNAPEVNSDSVADLTIGLLIAVVRKIIVADRNVRKNVWDRTLLEGAVLKGKTFGIVGFGKIGSRVAKRAKAFGMKVIAYDPYVKKDIDYVNFVEFEELLKKSDFISIHVPLTDKTKNMFDDMVFSKVKKGVYIINTSRGEVVDEDALVKYIKNGRIAGVALDVFKKESTESPIFSLDERFTVLTPHIGASTADAQQEAGLTIARDIVRFFEGRDVEYPVNLPHVDADTLKRLKPYISLAIDIGRVLTQLSSGVSSIDVGFGGELIDMKGRDLITRNLLASILSEYTSNVNQVNSLYVAKRKGISVREYNLGSIPYKNMIDVAIVDSAGKRVTAKGVLIDGREKIVELNGLYADFEPKGKLLLFEGEDKFGVIGKFGTVLAKNRINIAEMHHSRRKKGETTLVSSRVDQKITKKII